jgi:hypothetical protein
MASAIISVWGERDRLSVIACCGPTDRAHTDGQQGEMQAGDARKIRSPPAGAVAPRRRNAYINSTSFQPRERCRQIMTSFEDRERAFENKFARDEEMQFRIIARRNRLVGVWAAELMKLTPEETDAYAKAVVQADFEEAGDEDVIRKLLGDLTAAGVDSDEATVRAALDAQLVTARRQLIEEV